MDLSLIATAITAISAARDIGKAAVELRDFNQLAAATSQIREQVLKAQDSLFAHNGQLFAMQQEIFDLKDLLRQKESALVEAQNEIAKIKQKKLELEQYERFRLTEGGWVYRRKEAATEDEKKMAYCPNCFEDEHLSMLQLGTRQDRNLLVCPRCAFKTRR